MKNLKALIKIERTPVLFMGIYFLLINIIATIAMVGQINASWQCYLAQGISAFYTWTMDGFVYGITSILLIGYGIGLLVLVYLQFRKDKSIEISRFIKALPYTNGQRSLVKIGLGLLSFTFAFAVYVVIFLIIRSHGMHLFSEVYGVTAFEEVAIYLNRPEAYLSFMGITYVRMIVIYLIFIMCEYLMSHNIGSLIVAILSAAAPVYIWLSVTYDMAYTETISKVSDWLFKIYMDYTQWGQIKIAGANEWDYVSYTITEAGGIILMIYLAIIVVCSIVIVTQVKKQRVENADIFMPRKLTRYVFIGGVAICSACLIRDIGRVVLGQIAFGYPVMILYVLLAIGLVVGGFIATKIAHIGLQGKKEV